MNRVKKHLRDRADEFKTAFWTCAKGRKSSEHKHMFVEHIVCVYGQYKVKMSEEVVILYQGDELHIPSGILHSGECITDAGLFITIRKNLDTRRRNDN